MVGHDHLGHGSSVAPGAARLYFGPMGSWKWVVDDIEKRRCLARESFPNVPYFLLGHSMGSFLARTYLIRYPGRVDGAISRRPFFQLTEEQHEALKAEYRAIKAAHGDLGLDFLKAL